MKDASSALRSNPWFFLLPAGVILAGVLVLPILQGLQLSFFDWNLRGLRQAPVFLGLDNFAELFTSENFRESIRVTLVFTLSVVALELFVGTLLALLLEQGLAGLRLFRTLFVLPIMVAPVVVGIIWKFLYNQSYGKINYFLQLLGGKPVGWTSDPAVALIAVIITDVWQWTPFVFLLVLAGLQGVPKDITEASVVDGANYLQNLRHIKLPYISSVLGITAILRLIDAFRSLEVVYNLTFGGPGVSTEVLSLHLYRTAFVSGRLGLSSAIAVILLGLIVVLSLPVVIRNVSGERGR